MRTNGPFSWGILLCKFSDHPEEPRSPDYFRDLLVTRSKGGISDYWSSMSYGALNMGDATVYGWVNIGTAADATFRMLSRWNKTEKCVAAVLGTLGIPQLPRFSTHDGLICIVNTSVGDSGRAGDRILLDLDGWRHTFIAHEVGHVLGLDHSFDVNSAPWDAGSDARPGAYGDSRDIMSAETFAGLQTTFNGNFGSTGPGLCALTRAQLGWLDASRVFEMKVKPGENWNNQAEVSAVDAPAARGNPLFRVTADGTHNGIPVERIEYTVEFRPRIGWDAGLPADAVTIRMMGAGDVARITWSGNGTQDWHVDETFFDAVRKLAISVVRIASDKSTASVAFAAGTRAGMLSNFSVRKTLSHRYDLSQGLRKIKPRPPFRTDSVRLRLLDNPPQLAG